MNSLILIGYRGTGKTTVGRILAERLQVEFVDADHLLEEREGRSIARIFAAEGEPYFRDRETAILQELAGRERIVISTGGGAVLREVNRAAIRMAGFTVWLEADAETIWRRIQADDTSAGRRPNLTVGGLAEIQQLLNVRSPLYRACADLRISAAAESPECLADAILAAWGQFRPDARGTAAAS